VARGQLLAEAERERTTVPKTMVLEPSGLPERQLSDIREALARHRDAIEVYLVRRRVTTLPEKPCYLIGIRPRRRLTGGAAVNEPALIRSILDAVPWPPGSYAAALVGKNRWLRAKLRAMDALLIEQ
jgi:hypothetical protein